MKKFLAPLFLLALLLSGCNGVVGTGLSVAEAQTVTEDFINEYLIPAGPVVTITEMSDEGSYFKGMVDIGQGQIKESYLSKDGTEFFPQAMLIDGAGQDKLSQSEVQKVALEFINANLMAPDTTASIKDISDTGSLYKMTVDIGDGQTVESYISDDGAIFFPQVINIQEFIEDQKAALAKQEAAAAAQAKALTKSEKPVVELFVMSHCPYGTQIEKGIIPVAKALSDKIDFQLKFVNYAMHGQQEIDEELNQYCVNKNHPDKFISYLECFLEAGDGSSCLNRVGVDTDQISACAIATDTEFGISADYEDKGTWKGSYPSFNIHNADNTKYGVQGSPTLVVNGKQVQSGRDSQSLLTTICAAFETAPTECDQEFSSFQPSPGFGYQSGSEVATDASCE